MLVDEGGSVSQNGDDAIELYHGRVVVDIFGELYVDGSGTTWEYLDAWAHRNCDARELTNIVWFDENSWEVADPNCTDDATDNSNENGSNPCPYPVDDCTQQIVRLTSL